jgi:hypothetical protein
MCCYYSPQCTLTGVTSLTASLGRNALELQHPLFCTQLSADLWSSIHAVEFVTADLICRYAVERPPRQPTLTSYRALVFCSSYPCTRSLKFG